MYYLVIASIFFSEYCSCMIRYICQNWLHKDFPSDPRSDSQISICVQNGMGSGNEDFYDDMKCTSFCRIQPRPTLF